MRANRVLPIAALLCVLAAIVAAASTGRAQAESAEITVTLDVPSTTIVDLSGCPHASSATNFGTVLPGTTAVTATPCAVSFGSPSAAASLRLLQADGVGTAMFRMTTGDPDTGFGPSGIRTIPVGAGQDNGMSTAVQRDGKIVVVGRRYAAGNSDVVVMRLRPDGTADPDFNSGSPRIIDIGSTEDIAMSVALQRDGGIVVGGHSGTGAGRNGFVLRLLPDGSSDPSFGGIRTIDYAGNDDSIEAIRVDSEGRIVGAGGAGVSGTQRFGVFRLLPDGTFDPDFNGTGKRTIAVSGWSAAGALALRPDDGIVLAGMASGSGLDLAVAVLKADGSDDASFNGTGAGKNVIAMTANAEAAQGVAIQPDGKIIAVGSTEPSPGVEKVAVVRFLATGPVDTSFGGGAQSLSFGGGSDYAEGVLVQPDGAVLVVGGANGYTDSGLLRLTPDGEFDETFSDDGRLVINAGGNDGLQPPALGPDGRVYVGGTANNDFHVIALLGTQYPDFAGAWTGSRFGACLETLSSGSNTWPVAGAGNCTIATPASWRGIAATSGDPNDLVATSGGGGTVTAELRFGVSVDGAQARGTYVAPVEFEVLAP